jgi:prophage antirepressor-like protein
MNESKSNNIEMNIKIYNFNDYNLTVVGDNEEPWFVGKEVAELLGYSDTKKAIQKFVEDDEKIFYHKYTEKATGSNRTPCSSLQIHPMANLINEDGLYSLIFQSKMPIAINFKKWIKSVIKEIRLTGKYQLETKLIESEKKCLQFESKLLENESKLVETKKEIETKSCQINQLKLQRFLIDTDKHIKLTTRLCHLDLIQDTQVIYLYKHRRIVIDDEQCKVIHPQINIWEGHILQLSKRLSGSYRKSEGKNPDIETKNRRNIYNLKFYQDIGDAIIEDYFKRIPLDEWDINWDWEIRHSEEVGKGLDEPTIGEDV